MTDGTFGHRAIAPSASASTSRRRDASTTIATWARGILLVVLVATWTIGFVAGGHIVALVRRPHGPDVS